MTAGESPVDFFFLLHFPGLWLPSLLYLLALWP